MTNKLNFNAVEVNERGMTCTENGCTMEWPQRWALTANEGDSFALVICPPDYPDEGETEYARFIQGKGEFHFEILGTDTFFKLLGIEKPSSWEEIAEVAKATFGDQFRGLMSLEQFEESKWGDAEPRFRPAPKPNEHNGEYIAP